MLVLSRKQGETIHIGDEIVVEVRRIVGNRVVLAIDAPEKYRILRGELVLQLSPASNGSLSVSLSELVRQAREKLGADVQGHSAS